VADTVASPGARHDAESVALQPSSARIALSVFFLSGLMMSFPGAILPAWGYHLRHDFAEMGLYFLALVVGVVLSVPFGARLHRRRSVGFTVIFGCALAALALACMALVPPPAHWGWRAGGTFVGGVAAGLMNMSAFQSLTVLFERDRAAVVNLAGVMFGMGCLVMALLSSSTFYTYTVGSTLLLLSLIPGFSALLYRRLRFPAATGDPNRTWRDVWAEVKSPGAVLFTTLLFLQFANEWSVAGWLPVFLVQTVGLNPAESLLMLSAYWFFLLAGRILAQALLPRAGHGKLLILSAGSALFGSLILWSTNNRFGAWSGLLLLGGGFAMIYPLVVEKIGHRFPGYHPGFFNGLFSIGIAGGLLVPFLLGHAAEEWGIRTVMLFPFCGTILVFALVILLWIETRLTSAHPSR
jgi:fucose permease